MSQCLMLAPSELVDLGYRPHRFQRAIHERARRFTVCVAHRRFGKTYLAVMTLIDSAVRTRKPDARFSYVAPFLKQAKRVSWDYAKRFSARIPGIEIREGDLIINYPNGSRLSLFGADNPEAMRGVYNDGAVLDEMADFRPDVWPEIIRPTLSDRRGWAFFIGTPKGVNQFSELYGHATGGTDPEWAGMMYRADETDLIDAKELASARAIMSDAQYRQEFLCDFSASADNVLITIDIVSAAAKKDFRRDEIDGAPKIIGVDVARFGDDRTVIQRRQGLAALAPIVMHGVDNMEVVGRLIGQIVEWRPDAVFIDAGRGEGVIDRVRQLGYAVIEVNFGGRANDPSAYVNKRAQMWDDMRRWFDSGGGIPNHPDLKTDLCVPSYKFDGANRFCIESKDDIRKRGMRSPDLADALALTFAEPVRIASPMAKQSTAITQKPYDPFADLDRMIRPGPDSRAYDPFA
jgi:hypothetical protein